MAGWEDLIGPILGFAGDYMGGKQAAKAPPPTAQPGPGAMSMPPSAVDAGGAATMVNQSPGGQQSGQDAQQKALLDYYLGQDQEEAMRKQAMVQQLRDYGGGASPQMRLGQAPKALEYAAVLGNRLTSQYGQNASKEAERRALEDWRRRQYGGGGGAAGAAPVVAGNYPAMDTGDYGGA